KSNSYRHVINDVQKHPEGKAGYHVSSASLLASTNGPERNCKGNTGKKCGGNAKFGGPDRGHPKTSVFGPGRQPNGFFEIVDNKSKWQHPNCFFQGHSRLILRIGVRSTLKRELIAAKCVMGQTPRYSQTLTRLAITTGILGLLHHADHVFRGNHSGWPFTHNVTPFTFSLLIYPLLLYGILRARQGKLVAKYWLVGGSLLAALITFVHYIP